jgi:hypothetical protein
MPHVGRIERREDKRERDTWGEDCMYRRAEKNYEEV